ncbi:MAG: plasmid partitioning protein RepB [Rubellimicrobium sp.]|nr:plasmid partitioning protein RepB [Rubellimicrobium sp.]
MGSTLMGRNIFNQTAVDVPPSPAPAKPTKLGGSVGGLRESLREITANSIRDIDPEQIEVDGLRDRLAFDDDGIDLLAESIRKHGQQVPIMVRPSGQPDRYRVVYGRRRLAAIRQVGGPVKAIVRTLDDDASLIAQGQENNLRLDPSFIEKALFIKEMQEAGYRPGVIQDALGLTRQGISNHRVVIEQLPDELIRLIGPAHGTGRRQWGDLAALASKVSLAEVARTALAALPQDAPGSDRFQTVYNACLRAAKGSANRSKQGRSSTVKDEDGNVVATLTFDAKSIGIKVTRKDNPEFGLWLEERAEAALRDLFHQWRDEGGQEN